MAKRIPIFGPPRYIIGYVSEEDGEFLASYKGGPPSFHGCFAAAERAILRQEVDAVYCVPPVCNAGTPLSGCETKGDGIPFHWTCPRCGAMHYSTTEHYPCEAEGAPGSVGGEG